MMRSMGAVYMGGSLNMREFAYGFTCNHAKGLGAVAASPYVSSKRGILYLADLDSSTPEKPSSHFGFQFQARLRRFGMLAMGWLRFRA